jgi:hypothetical protein
MKNFFVTMIATVFGIAATTITACSDQGDVVDALIDEIKNRPAVYSVSITLAEADYAEIRLAEIYYSLAECKFRQGDVQGAGSLLNQVRKRNYPVEKHAEYLYAPDGPVQLTENELIDEWGREFFAEGRRRTDLCRWNKFTTGTWWDKQPDADSHTDIFPISRRALGANRNLVQNPGYAGL